MRRLCNLGMTIISIDKVITSIKSFIDVSSVLEKSDDMQKFLTPQNSVEYLQRFRSPPQITALVFIIPVNLCPLEIYKSINYMFSQLKSYETRFLTGISIRYGKASILCLKQQESIKVLENLIKIDEPSFITAYLYLAASIRSPVSHIPSSIKNPRTFTMSLYYCGINFLLLRDFAMATTQLQRCILFPCTKDIMPSAIDAFMLASFLNHYPKQVSYSIIPQKYQIPIHADSIWNGRDMLFQQNGIEYPRLYIDLWDCISDERIRRGILFFSKSSTQIPLDFLLKNIGCYNQEKALSLMKECTDFTVCDNIVCF